MQTGITTEVSAPPAGDPPLVPTLGYANPKVFFAGANRYRSRQGIWGIAACSVLAVGFCFVAVALARSRGLGGPAPVRWAFTASFGAAAAFLVGLLACAVWAWIVRHETPVRVTEDGVERGRRGWTWQQVSGFGGTRAGRGVVLGFTVGRGHIRFPRDLATTPPLTEAEYADLVERLTTYLAEHHPHVRVEKTPRSSD